MRTLSVLLLALVTSTGGCAWVGDRGMDFADCFRVVGGVGLGLAVDAQVTDYVSPGVGIASLTWNYGWFDREIHGAWVESDIINTPRLAYEALASELGESGDVDAEEDIAVARLALASLNLPNERWIRRGDVVRVEHFAFFNFFGAGEEERAAWLSDLLVGPGDVVMRPDKSVWQQGWIEVGVTAVLVHARIGFNPLELVDFLGGIVGLDPADDDGDPTFYRLRRFEPERRKEHRFWDVDS